MTQSGQIQIAAALLCVELLKRLVIVNQTAIILHCVPRARSRQASQILVRPNREIATRPAGKWFNRRKDRAEKYVLKHCSTAAKCLDASCDTIPSTM